MEIKINIPQNDYVQPTDVREEVVQMICNSLLHHYLDSDDCRDIEFAWKKPQAQILVHGYKTPYLTGGAERNKVYDENIIVRTCEMKAAFDALQDAGYYIYGFLSWTGNTSYHISSKPVYAGRNAERTSFSVFID